MTANRIITVVCGGLFLALVSTAEARPRLSLGFGPSLAKLKRDCLSKGRAVSCAKAAVKLEKQGKKQEAAALYQRACQAKTKPLGSACFLWGLLSKDKKKHAAIFKRGCTLKDGDSCTAAGSLAAKGGDKTAAMALYRKGCDFKDGRGCHRIARYLVKGRKIAEAQQLLRHSCVYGYPAGCGYLGWLYENMQKKYAKAKRAYQAGCKLKGAVECARLGLLLHKRKQPKVALRYLRRACRWGYRRSCAFARKLNLQLNGPPKRR